MFRLIFFLGVAVCVTGCASLSYPLPKCDGYSKRPLNRSMWQWEGSRSETTGSVSTPAVQSGSAALGYAAIENPAARPVALAAFDPAASYRACGA